MSGTYLKQLKTKVRMHGKNSVGLWSCNACGNTKAAVSGLDIRKSFNAGGKTKWKVVKMIKKNRKLA